MSQKLSPLLALQKLDLRILEITEQRRKIPERLNIAEAPLREDTQLLTDAKTGVDALVKERRTHEKDLEMHEAQTEKMKSHAASLKTNKEYQAHLFEIELANKKRGEFEEKILVSMDKIDQLQGTIKELQGKVNAAQAVFSKEKQALDAADKELATELAQLEAEQRAAAKQIDPNLLARYTHIKLSRKDGAIAAVREGMCAGCRLQIPPQLIAQVRRSDDLHVCPYCRRMLYWEGEIPTESASALSVARKNDLEVGESV
ncbi:MAG: C4-type zinc ribbon domain-containing protein [Nitrospira sp.]|nr:C4-type zinc ribbon domain-containing protein [Nitrospira sp.]